MTVSTSNDNPTDKKQDHQLISGFHDLGQITTRLFSNAKQLIQIYTSNLDPRILSQRSIEQSMIKLIKSSRKSQIQIMIQSEEHLKGIDHRLVSLAQRFTSYIEIKLIPKDYYEEAFAFYLIDRRNILFRQNRHDYQAEYRQMPDFLIKDKSRYFDKLWQESSPASFLRSLYL